MSVPAATALALWAAAHTAGASADELLAAIAGFGVTSGVRRANPAPSDPAAGTAAVPTPAVRTAAVRTPADALPGPGEAPAGAAALLPLLRSARPSLVLPREGDVRGLPVPGGQPAAAAVRAGAAVVFFDAAVTIVPIDGSWRVFTAAGRPVTYDLLVAREELDAAVERATQVFVRSDLGIPTTRARQEIAEFIDGNSVRLPPGTPVKSAALLDRCVQLEALLTVIATHRTAAINGYQLDQVDAALAPLADAARHGRAAAVELAVGSLLADGLPTDEQARLGSDRNT